MDGSLRDLTFRPEDAAWLQNVLAAGAQAIGRVVPATYPAFARVASPGPISGTLDGGVADTLARVLSRFTGTPSDCSFAIWEGYAGTGISRDAPTIELPPQRRMYVYTGPIELAQVAVGGEAYGRRPVRWWPADHAWCVGADIYSTSVLVGGSEECVAALVGDAQLDAQTVDAAQDLTEL